jgi:SlyX protein
MTKPYRLETIEAKLAHLELAVQQISDVVARQQRQLDLVLARAQRLGERLQALDETPGAGASASDYEKPPHY